MLIIRLIKTGKKNSASFRIVLTEKTAGPKSGKFLEILGSYNPRLKQIDLKQERIQYWLSQGVKTSDTVHNLLVSNKIIKADKIKKKIKSKKKVESEKKEKEPNLDKTEPESKIEKE